MDNREDTIQVRKLLHVEIYDELYKRVLDGTFPPGSFLPSEPKLAELLGVSRVTLRRAISLLQEDGLIKSVRGSGNLVTRAEKPAQSGLETIAHPVYLCCAEKPDVLETDCSLEETTEYQKSIFRGKATMAMVVKRWFQLRGELLAFSISFIPVEAAERLQVDLGDESAVLALLERDIYKIARSSAIEVKAATTSSFVTDRYDLPENEIVLLIAENLFCDEGTPFVHSKHYIITQNYNIRINGLQEKENGR